MFILFLEIMMETIDKRNAVDFFLTLRCTSRKYAKEFVEKGIIKFNTPQSWVDYGEKQGRGRGDVLEGTFACCNQLDLEHLKLLSANYNMSKNANIEKYYKEGKIYFKRKNVMQLPVFCVYLLKANMVDWPDSVGWHTIKTRIPSNYFQDFADYMTPAQIKTLPVEEQPSVVFIRDFDAFKERLVNKLISLGIDKNEIIITPITYYDFNKDGIMGWFDLRQQPPFELAIKDISFSNQSEARVIIFSKNNFASDYLKNNVIELGPLLDIAAIADGYFSEGLDFSCEVELVSIKDMPIIN